MEPILNPLNIDEKPVGATLAVARPERIGLPSNGTGQARPLRSCSLRVRDPAPGVETRMEQIRNPSNIIEKTRRGDPCGRPHRDLRLVVRGTGQARPLRSCYLRVRDPAPGVETLMEQIRNPSNIGENP